MYYLRSYQKNDGEIYVTPDDFEEFVRNMSWKELCKEKKDIIEDIYHFLRDIGFIGSYLNIPIPTQLHLKLMGKMSTSNADAFMAEFVTLQILTNLILVQKDEILMRMYLKRIRMVIFIREFISKETNMIDDMIYGKFGESLIDIERTLVRFVANNNIF